MPDILATFGTIGGYTVTLQRRASAPGDAYPLSQVPQVQALVLTKGASVTEIAVAEDVPPFSSTTLVGQGKAIISAFAAIGAQVTLGEPGAPLASNPNGSGAYIRAVDLVPGTPLPAGRGVRVSGTGEKFTLKLAGGGTLPAYDATGAGGTIIDRVAVVDATVPAGGKVQILY